MGLLGGKNRSGMISADRLNISSCKSADKVPLVWVILGCIFLIASSVFIPLTLTSPAWSQVISFAIGVACAVLIVVSVRSLPEILIAILIYSFIYYASGSSVIPTLLFSTVFCVSVFSSLLASSKGIRLVFTLLSPALSFGAAFLAVKDPILSLLSLIWLPCAIGLGICTRCKQSKTVGAVVFSALSCLTGAAVAIVYIFTVNNGLSVEIINNAFNYLRDESTKQMVEAIKLADTVEITEGLIREIRAAVDAMINLLPGTVIFFATAIGYFIHRSACALLDVFGIDKLTGPTREPIRADIYTAFTFVIFFMTTFTTNSSGNLSFLATVGQNICLILSPILIAVGWKTLTALPRKMGLLTLAVWGGVILFVAMSEISVLSVISLVGAFGTMIESTDRWAKDHYGKKAE